MILPSKELLDEVLSEILKKHNPNFKETLGCRYDEEFALLHINYKEMSDIICGYLINTYELAHKCKEWAFNRLYSLESAKRNILSEENKMVDTWICCGFSPSMDILPNFTANTEPEAIFKACEWIRT